VFAALAGASPTREEISAAMACAAGARCARPPPASPPKPKKRSPRRPSAFDKGVESLPLRVPPLRPQQVMTFDDDHHRVVVSVAMARFCAMGIEERSVAIVSYADIVEDRLSADGIHDVRVVVRTPSETARVRALGAPQTVGKR